MQRSERLIEYTNQEPEWVPQPPFRWRKVNGARWHLTEQCDNWEYDHGDWDAIMILTLVERRLDSSIPRWHLDARSKKWQNEESPCLSHRRHKVYPILVPPDMKKIPGL